MLFITYPITILWFCYILLFLLKLFNIFGPEGADGAPRGRDRQPKFGRCQQGWQDFGGGEYQVF
jgi:hypothetical protein